MARIGFGRPTLATARNAFFVIIFVVCVAIALMTAPLRLGIALAAGLLAMAAVCVWVMRDRKSRPKHLFVNELAVDDAAVRYSEFSDRTVAMSWDEIDRVVYYFGPPDYPDPWAGSAPDREWQLYRSGPGGSLYIPDMREHSRRLAQWCARKLPGFRADLLDEARASREEKSWILWQRTDQPEGQR